MSGPPASDDVLVEVLDQLIQRFGAGAAREAVFEDEQRPRVTLGQQPIEFVHVREGE